MLPSNLLLQNRYQIIRKIAQGGMGAVYEAVDQRLGHTVALKQIVRGDSAVFEQEARLLARLRHPALPKVSDHFVDDAGQFLVMDFIPGDDLATLWLRRKAELTPEAVLAWGAQLLAVLEYLHHQTPPVIHRDIKPANLKLTTQGQLILLDFGLAKGKTGQTAAAQKSVVGYTLCYAAPEQIRGEGTDERSDLYSVAATLYHLLLGSTPPDAIQRVLAVADGASDPLLSWHPPPVALPPMLLAVLHKAMALNPAERFVDAAAFRAVLQTALQTETVVSSQAAPTPPAKLMAVPPPHNLPIQLTTLIGRTQEITTLQSWLAREEVRLITLTGAGGSGKTRLALAVAQTFLDTAIDPTANSQSRQFTDGLFFVNLAAIRDADLVISTIAQVLGVKETAGSPLQTTLHAYLRDKRMLLVLDNFEQVIAAAPLVTDLLMNCPLLKVIVTSREVLRVRGEQEFLVPLLATPDPTQTVSLDKLMHYAAVELFVQRAQAVKADFALDTGNATAVAELCSRLDGLPLAIELAAARMKVLTPHAMLTRLNDRFKLLRGGARDLPDRQQTLQATLEWSYELLTEDEKTLFQRLAVFVGGCTLEAVEEVCNPPDDEKVPPLQLDVLDGLASLLDKSLLQHEIGLDGKTRFMMLASIHEYAAARLAESDETGIMRQRHTMYYTVLAEQAELAGATQNLWLNLLGFEHDNLRAALYWAEGKDSKVILRLTKALWPFWEVRGYLHEATQWLTTALIISSTSVTPIRAKILVWASALARIQGDFAKACTFLEESLELYQKLADQPGIAQVLGNLGLVKKYQGDYSQAKILCKQSLTLFRALGDMQRVAITLNYLGVMADDQGDYEQAKLLYEESLALKRDLKDKRGIAYALNNLGLLTHQQGNYTSAKSFYEQSLILKRELGDKKGIASTLGNLGFLARIQGDYEQAKLLYEESLSLEQDLGAKESIAMTLHNLGCIASVQRDYERSEALDRASLALHREVGNKRGIAYALLGLGATSRHRKEYTTANKFYIESLTFFQEVGDKPGIVSVLDDLVMAKILAGRDYVRAAQLYGAVEAARKTLRVPLLPTDFNEYNRILVVLYSKLDNESLSKLLNAGRNMTLEQAVEYVLLETE